MEQIVTEATVPANIATQMEYNNNRLFECFNLTHLILNKLIGMPLPDDVFAGNDVNCLLDQIVLSDNLISNVHKKLEEILHEIGE